MHCSHRLSGCDRIVSYSCPEDPMSVPQHLGRVFHLCCKGVGWASMFLLPVCFTLSFFILAALSFGIWQSLIPVAVVFASFMIAITGMVFIESGKYAHATAFHRASMPLHRFAWPSLDPIGPATRGDLRAEGAQQHCEQ